MGAESTGSSAGRSGTRRRRVVRGSRPAGDPRGTGSRGSTGRKPAGQKSGGQKSGGQRSGGQRGAQQSHGRSSGGGRNRNQQQQQRRRPQRAQQRPQQREQHPVVRSTDPVAIAGAATGVDMSLSFADMGLPEPVVRELTRQGLVHPFPIQAAAIPDGLAGRDVLGRGPTGSGKTFTFGLPVITRLVGGASKPGHPRGLVLVPTRELAQQVAGRLRPLAESVGQRVIEIVGGVNIKRHITALARPVDILVATPGRAEDLIGQGKLSFDSVETIALDEADQMADMGFLPQVRRLLDRTPSDAQHLFFSATLDGDIKVLIQRYMNDPVTHSTGEVAAKVERMDHYLGVVPDKPARNDVVIELGLASTKTIMFMRTKHTVDRQVKKLVRAGVSAVGLHGNKGQGARTRAIGEFADGTATVLVATDIAARGIDIKGVDLVVHIDPPAEHKAYVHRAGRTARAGERGTVLTLTTAETEKDTLAMMKKAGVSPTVWRLGTHGIGDHLTDLGLSTRGAARGKKPGPR